MAEDSTTADSSSHQNHLATKVQSVLDNAAKFSSLDFHHALNLLASLGSDRKEAPYPNADQQRLQAGSRNCSRPGDATASKGGAIDVSQPSFNLPPDLFTHRGSGISSSLSNLRTYINHVKIKSMHNEFSNEVAAVASSLETLQNEVAAILATVQTAADDLQRNQATNSKILERARALQATQKWTMEKHALASSFLSKIGMPQSVMEALLVPIPATQQTSDISATEIASNALTDEFFSAVDSALTVRSNAKRLLSVLSTYDIKGDSDVRGEPGRVHHTHALETASESAADQEHLGGLQRTAAKDALQESEELLRFGFEKLFEAVQVLLRSVEDPYSMLSQESAEEVADGLPEPSDIPLHAAIGKVSAPSSAPPSEVIMPLHSSSLDSPPSSQQPATHITRAPTFSSALTIGKAMRRALCLLWHRTDLYNRVIDLVVERRRQLLVRRFHEALARGSADGSVRPIEMFAFDSIRYIADILAWIHTAAASDVEFAVIMTELAASSQREGAVDHLPDESQHEDTALCGKELKRSRYRQGEAFEAIVPSFRVRVEQALTRSSASPVDLARINQLLTFYASTLLPLLTEKGSSAPALLVKVPDTSNQGEVSATEMDNDAKPTVPLLIRCCGELAEEARRLFVEAWEAQTLRLSQLPATSLWLPDFSVPRFVVEITSSFVEVLEIQETSLPIAASGMDSNRDDISKADFSQVVLNAALTPLLNFCRQAAQFLPLGSKSVYLLNCYSHVQNAISRFATAASHVGLVASLIDELVGEMVQNQYDAIADKIGFSERLKALEHWERKSEELKARQPLSSVSSMHPLSLAACLQAFYSELYSMGALALPHVDMVSSRALRSEVRQGVLSRVADAYEKLYNGMGNDSGASHTPTQIRALLDV